MPFGALPIHAQMAEHAGFEAFEISGATASWYVGGGPDIGLMTMTEMVQLAGTVARSVNIPVFCDADTGYGGPMNVRRTTQEFIRAGVAGIHIEDQTEPKMAGGRKGIRLASDGEAVGRLQAAVDARDEIDPDFVIVARTDGYDAVGGSLEEAIRRGNLYLKEAGADVVFYEGLKSWEEIKIALESTDGPAYSIPARSVSRHPSLAEMSAMGQKINIFRFLVPGLQEAWKMLLEIQRGGEMKPMDDYLESLAKIEGTREYAGYGDLFINPTYDTVRQLEEKYLPKELRRDYDGPTGGD